MYCTKCGVEIRETDNFCSRCGTRISGFIEPAPRVWMLDKHNKKIAGVCAGLARYCGVDVTLVRVLWLGIALGTGVGFLVYLVAWIVVPSDHGFEARRALEPTPQIS
jgi:phage shock protein C